MSNLPILRLAAALPKGSAERRNLLAFLKQGAFSPGRIDMTTWEGDKITVPAMVYGVWGIHKVGKKWAVTHSPSGLALTNVSSRKKGIALVESMVEMLPSLLNASQADLNKHESVIMSLISGVLPFAALFREAGFRNLGTRYGKRGDHWGPPLSSMMIRVGTRDLVLMRYNILGWKQVKGRMAPEARWGAESMDSLKKITKLTLDAWIKRVQNAPTRAEMVEDLRSQR